MILNINKTTKEELNFLDINRYEETDSALLN